MLNRVVEGVTCGCRRAPRAAGSAAVLRAIPSSQRESPFHAWKAKFGGIDVSEARRLKSLEDGNARLKGLLADAMSDNAASKDILGKKP